ncbi:helix-turn-helix transcriptional regulator [Cerasibacillus sp. JNUCC 74]
MEKMSTKDKILYLLKRQSRLSVGELTKCLHITDMAVRKHLSILEKEKLIYSVEVKQPIGRPIQKYILTKNAELLFPKSYEGLAVEFLKDIEAMYGEESIEQLFQNREKRLTNEYKVRLKNKSPIEKIKELKTIQNEKGYMADVAKIGTNKYELIEYNCPILAVASEYKVACHCETSLFQKVLQTEDVKRTSCKTEGNDHCRFLIGF